MVRAARYGEPYAQRLGNGAARTASRSAMSQPTVPESHKQSSVGGSTAWLQQLEQYGFSQCYEGLVFEPYLVGDQGLAVARQFTYRSNWC